FHRSTVPSAGVTYERDSYDPQPGSSLGNPIILDIIPKHPPASLLHLQRQTQKSLIPMQAPNQGKESRKRSAQAAGLEFPNPRLPDSFPQSRHEKKRPGEMDIIFLEG